MLAGETSLLDSDITRGSVTRDLAVAVTAAHVLVFEIDFLDGQPRWVALAGRSIDVKIELRSFVFGLYPALWISSGRCSGGSGELRASSGRSRCWKSGDRPRPESNQTNHKASWRSRPRGRAHPQARPADLSSTLTWSEMPSGSSGDATVSHRSPPCETSVFFTKPATCV